MKKFCYYICIVYALMMGLVSSCASDKSDSGGSDGGGTTEGKGGSMARFTVKGDYMYAVASDSLKIFNIEDPAKPEYYPQRNLKIGFDIETIYPMDTLLFIGSRSGMYVYDISDPRFPTRLSEVSHIRSCDPVAAQDDYAFVTLNTNFSSCGTSVNNVLQIYDVSKPLNPVLLRAVELNGPTGLGVDGKKLFVCDKGLKVFEIVDPPLYVKQIDDLYDIKDVDVRNAYDVIPVDGLLFLVAKEGLFQFDYNGERLEFVSKIEIKR